MRSNKKTIELLAPARNAETAIAAVTCGADAVYIGASQFSARKAAGNDIAEIKAAVEFAHQYYARVYAVINTIIYDNEIDSVQNLIYDLADINVDGLIVQDMGLLELKLPDIPIISSTQMHNSTPERVKFLQDIGISRAILARELSLDEIKAIHQAAPNIELECFVHGALCVSMSGQCYMSYAVGGRSGNRGECAQPCRQVYTLEDTDGNTICRDKYLLSLKDLNLSEYLAELLDAGVSSFKIEGRLKTAGYVANVVGYYRQLLDSLLSQRSLASSSSGKVSLNFQPNPAKTFSRGFTDYGITGRQKHMASLDTPKAIGEHIGTVSGIGAVNFQLDSNTSLHNGDGICFLDNRGILQGTYVNNVEPDNIITPKSMDYIEVGTEVYRNFDHIFNKELEKLPAQRKIDISLTLSDTEGGVSLAAVDEDGCHVSVDLFNELEPAKNQQSASENIAKQLTRFGNTIFTCNNFKMETSQVWFFPVSTLNQLRRELVEKLMAKRLSARPIQHNEYDQSSTIPYPQSTLSYMGNILNEKAAAFYRKHGIINFEPAAESGLNMTGKQVMETRYCIRKELNLCPGPNAEINADDLILTDRNGNTFTAKFTCSKCGMKIYFQ